MTRTQLITLISVLPLPLIIWQLVLQPNALTFWNIMAVSFGAIAFSSLSFVLFLGARPRFIAYHVGQKAHRILAVIGIGAILLHNQAEGFVDNPENTHQAASYGGNAQTIFLIIAGLSLVFLATKWLLYTPAILQKYIKKLSFVRYDWVKWLHHFNLVAIALMGLHVVFINNALGAPLASSLYACYLIVALSFYVPLLYAKIRRANATIASMKSLSNTIVEMIVETNQPLAIGQTVWIRQRAAEHPLTIVDKHDTQYTFIFKKVGSFTKRLATLDAQTPLFLSKGYDALPSFEKPLLYIAGGSGITPALAAVNVWKQHPTQPFHLYWSVRTMDELALDGYFRKLQRTQPQFHYYPYVTREGTQQRLTAQDLAQNIDLETATVTICAAAKATNEFEHMLRELTIDDIFTESF